MTSEKQKIADAIQVLECAVKVIDTEHYGSFMGICKAIGAQIRPYSCWPDHAKKFMNEFERVLPEPIYFDWCYPFTPEGDEKRREFLRSHITRLSEKFKS